MLRILAGAIRPHAGGVTVDGVDLIEDPQSFRRRTALLSHAAFTYEVLTAFQNLEILTRILGGESNRSAVLAILERVGLAERADHAVSTFSAGMRKRLSLARVLLQDARIILLDEPYGNLDASGFELVDHLIAEWLRDERTVVIASHDLERTAPLCDEAILLREGRVVREGAALGVGGWGLGTGEGP